MAGSYQLKLLSDRECTCEYAARKAYTLANLKASSLLSTAWKAPSVSAILRPCKAQGQPSAS